MQCEIMQQKSKQKEQLQDVITIPLSQRQQYTLKTTQYLSRWKLSSKLLSSKFKNNIISNITLSHPKLHQHHSIIFNTLQQLISQIIYLIYSAAMNKINLQISKNIYLTQNFTLFGLYYLPNLNLNKKYQQLKKYQKNLTLTLSQLKDIFETNKFLNLQSNIAHLMSTYKRSVSRTFFNDQKQFLFYNFQFRSITGQDDLKSIILITIEIILLQLHIQFNSPQKIQTFSQSIQLFYQNRQSLSQNKQSVFVSGQYKQQKIKDKNLKIFSQIQIQQISVKLFNQLSNVSATWSDQPMKYLSAIQKSVDLIRNNSFFAKFKSYSFQGILLQKESKLELLSQRIKNERKFYQQFIKDYYQKYGYNQIHRCPITMHSNQPCLDFNYMNGQGSFVIQDTFFKSILFTKSSYCNIPDHIVLQYIQTAKREMLLQKTQILNVQENDQFCSIYLDYESYSQIVHKANHLQLRQVDIVNQQLNQKLYMADIAYYQRLKQNKSDDKQLNKIIQKQNNKLMPQIPILKLQLFYSQSIQDRKSKSQTLPQFKAQTQNKHPIIEINWVAKYLRNYLLDKQIYKCQTNTNLVIYLLQIKLICPQKLKIQGYKQLEKELIRLKNQQWSRYTQSIEHLQIQKCNKNEHYNVVMKMSMGQHDLSNIIFPLIRTIGLLMTYYINLQRLLRNIQSQCFGEDKQQGFSEQDREMYRQQLQRVKQRIPHQLQLTKSIQFGIKQQIIQNL